MAITTATTCKNGSAPSKKEDAAVIIEAVLVTLSSVIFVKLLKFQRLKADKRDFRRK